MVLYVLTSKIVCPSAFADLLRQCGDRCWANRGGGHYCSYQVCYVAEGVPVAPGH